MRALLAALLLLAADAAQAHRPSDAFLTLAVDGPAVRGQWEIALRDLEALAPLDTDGDRALTWGELRAAQAPLAQALTRALALEGDGQPCAIGVGDVLVHQRLDGPYAWFPLEARCAAPPATLALRYDLLFDTDPTHRGIVVLAAGVHSHGAVLAPDQAAVRFVLAAPSRARLFGDYLREGVHHIWIGLDHVLFLVALLLPCVLLRDRGAWRAAPALAPVLWEVARVVTAFTLAHSVTLTLAALGLLRLPAALTESVIALSVVLVALNNLWPLVTHMRWAAALLFGLVHGFGFASVLGELGLPDGSRLLALAAFNLGVELGQLAIVLLAVPLAFALRHGALYRRGLLPVGSLAVAALAAGWFAQRSGLLPG